MGDSDRGQLKFAWGKFDAAAPWMCWSKAAALLLAQWSGLERENRIKRQMQFLHFVQTVDCLILLSLTRSFRVRVPFCLCAFASHKWGTKEATECFSSLLLMHACLPVLLGGPRAFFVVVVFCFASAFGFDENQTNRSDGWCLFHSRPPPTPTPLPSPPRRATASKLKRKTIRVRFENFAKSFRWFRICISSSRPVGRSVGGIFATLSQTI